VDDLTGSESNVSEITFAIDGRDYTIDLNKANANKLRKAFQPYIDAGRKAGQKPGKSPAKPATPKPATPNGDAPAIRAWMREHGQDISNFGRIPVKYVEAYRRRDTSVFAQPESVQEALQSQEPELVAV
jgi:hypothetical protein